MTDPDLPYNPIVDNKEHEWLYQSGNAFFSRRIRHFLATFIVGSYDDTFYITYWSLLHMFSGCVFALVMIYYGLAKKALWYGFIVHVFWELWQTVIGMSWPLQWKGHNNVVDTIMDTVLFLFGLQLVLWIRRYLKRR